MMKKSFYPLPTNFSFFNKLNSELLTFVYVRQPFDRLVSAFYNKVVTQPKKVLMPEIVQLRDHLFHKYNSGPRSWWAERTEMAGSIWIKWSWTQKESHFGFDNTLHVVRGISKILWSDIIQL